ncbi:MAG TPA: ABC transporter permease [Gemmatimonadaceae bacterium]|nr:ABC transporter permease [Gemmatimonadaceae bacterium]
MSDRRLRYFEFWRRDPRRDVDDEIEFHLEARVADLVTKGLSPTEARRQATAEFGDARAVREQALAIDHRILRRGRRTEWWLDVLRDARVSLRSLRRTPTFAVTAVLCAALGIGVTAAILSATYSILIRPLPYADAGRLVAVYGENTVRGYHGSNISWPDYVSWRDNARTFASIGIWTWTTATLSDDASEAERAYGALVSANLFPTLGVRPILGRYFTRDEETPGRDAVVLLSHRLWQRRFASDSAIVGKRIMVDGRANTVVGVMPASFNFPDRGDIWLPFSVTPANEEHGNRGYAGAIGRLKPGYTIEQGTADLHAIDANLEREFPVENRGWRAEVKSMREDLVGDLEQPLKVFVAAVALVLLLVCANLANLMLARGTTRAREMAIRTALGASRRYLTMQLITESLLIAAFGGVLGIGIAWWGVRLLRFAFPDQVPPFFISLTLDAPALGFVAALTLATGILFGTVPALRASRADPSAALREGARGAGGGGSVHRSRLRSALVVAEIAFSAVLLVGAMLLVRSYQNLAATSLGFDEKGILSARVALPEETYSRARTKVFFDELFARLRAEPGVTAVASAQGIPFSGWNVQSETRIEGTPKPKPGEELIAHFQFVSPDYFKAIGVPLVRGRWFTEADHDTLNPVVLVNEQMVKKGFGGADPIGKRVHVGGDKDPTATVVGVVRDFRHYRLPEPMGPAVYFPYALYPSRQQAIVIRTTRADPHTLTTPLRNAMRALDPRLALYQVQTFDEAVATSLWRQRLQGNVLSIFAILAVVLACTGLYGVISYTVAERTREVGVRMALGATRGNVLALVFAQSGRLVVAGIALGLVAAFFATRLLETLLYGIRPTDLTTFFSVPACLAVVALAAALIPARRATKVDPIIAMRAD